MVDTEGVIQSKTVVVQPSNEQQAATNEDNPEKENFTNGTINNIHTFLFDILAFFFNSQSSLIAEYCQETQNVCREQFERILLDYLFQWNFIQRFFNDEDTHILPIFYCDPQERNRLSKGSSIGKYLWKFLMKNKNLFVQFYQISIDQQKSRKLALEYVIYIHPFSPFYKILYQIGLDKPFEDGGVIFMKPNAIKLTDKNYKNVCEFMVEMNY